jgi:lipopolysaccharide transport system ATP-binding protein
VFSILKLPKIFLPTLPNMKPILEIQKVSKKYKIQHLAGGYLSLREQMVRVIKFQKIQSEDFWALKDVSFSVEPGESVGIIGRNGAGKSTLLKILSKITPPTTGRIISRGRIASLLEVGTGFHPELSGRENIFFNGSLLGMKRKEIESKFDEIVDFSGVEKFLDTPLKHFSSGMQLRLAFAVAAFLEPEILIIDEVLAVGDAEFQKKCLGKMEDVSRSGRTILFVSHNMGIVKQLCKRSILLEKGLVKMVEKTDQVIHHYLFQKDDFSNRLNSHDLSKGVTIKNLSIDPSPLKSLGEAQISLELESLNPIAINSIGFFFTSLLQERMGIIDLRQDVYRLRGGEILKMIVHVKGLPLIEGEYKIGLFIGSDLISGNYQDLMSLFVESPTKTNGVLAYPVEVRGKLEFDYDFSIEKN